MPTRKDRFAWQGDDATVTYSQCSDCINNTGIGECSVYGEKPKQFAENKETCPSHEPE